MSQACSKNVTEQLGESWDELQKCVNGSFGNPHEISYTTDNSILAASADQWKEYGSLYWPAVVINSVTFRGELTRENVLDAICKALDTRPRACTDLYALKAAERR